MASFAIGLSLVAFAVDPAVAADPTTAVPAADAAPAVAVSDTTAFVDAEVGFLASDSALGGTGTSTAALSTAAAVSASVCRGGIDYPHISGTPGVTYTINTHLDGVCRVVPVQHSISGSLYRSRWYGWEHLTSGSLSKPGVAKFSLYLNKRCTAGDWYRYRASGRFYALVGTTRWSTSFFNQNPDEIKCVRTAGATS